jgi:hypothetical protein
MALKPVTDPNLLTALNSAQAPDPSTVPGPKPVQDPALLAQLNAPEPPPGPPALGDDIPQPPETPAPQAAPMTVWESFLNKTGLDQIGSDPVLNMWGHGLTTAAKGLPETAGGMLQNTLATIGGGLGAPLEADPGQHMADFQQRFGYDPKGESAQQLTEGLGEAFNLQPAKDALSRSLDAGPGLDTIIQSGPEFAMAAASGPAALRTAKAAQNVPLKPTKVVNPKVDALRSADIRLRPSDVRAIEPNKNVKVPGEFREKFADGPDLKRDMTLHNQTRLTDTAAKDIGAKNLDDASLDAAEQPAVKVYETAESVIAGNPKGVSPEFEAVFREAAASAKLPKDKNYSVTRVIGALRRRAAKRMQNDQVATEEAGYADRDLADRLEEQFGKELEAAGEPQLLGEYRDARQQFAKIHDVRTATRAGQIDANMVRKLRERGTKLSGGLELIADAAEYAPNVTGHSLKTAAREGAEIPTTFAGGITELGKKAIRAIPGMDVGAPRFQENFGTPNEARASNYGRPPYKPTTRSPEQGGLDLRETLELDAPPGEVGAPARPQRDLGPQSDMLGEAFEFNRPAGEVGIPPEVQMSLQELLGLGEPLAMKAPPGRVGKPKRKS